MRLAAKAQLLLSQIPPSVLHSEAATESTKLTQSVGKSVTD